MILFQTYSFHIYDIRTCIDRSVVSFDLKGEARPHPSFITYRSRLGHLTDSLDLLLSEELSYCARQCSFSLQSHS